MGYSVEGMRTDLPSSREPPAPTPHPKLPIGKEGNTNEKDNKKAKFQLGIINVGTI